MSSLTSSSTLAQVKAAYIDNASYAEDVSVTKAKAFVTACRILLLKLPAEAGTRESHVRLNPELIQKEMAEARTWIAANDTASTGSAGPRVTFGGFERFR